MSHLIQVGELVGQTMNLPACHCQQVNSYKQQTFDNLFDKFNWTEFILLCNIVATVVAVIVVACAGCIFVQPKSVHKKNSARDALCILKFVVLLWAPLIARRSSNVYSSPTMRHLQESVLIFRR